MITKNQSFWIGFASFTVFIFTVAYFLGHEAFNNVLALAGAWQIGCWANKFWEWVSEKYVKKS